MTNQDQQPGQRVPSQIRAIVDRIGAERFAMGDGDHLADAEAWKQRLGAEGAERSMTFYSGGGSWHALAVFKAEDCRWLIWTGYEGCAAAPGLGEMPDDEALMDAFFRMEESDIDPADRYDWECEHVQAVTSSPKAGPSPEGM